MELLLILVVGGLAVWLMRPLRDWYVVEACQDVGNDGESRRLSKEIFAALEGARQAWEQRVREMREAGESGEVCLWRAEARSRKQALSGALPEGRQAVLMEMEKICP